MKKYKATWSLYSSRRKITLESLIKQGKVTGYESYVNHCDSLSVEPLTHKDFTEQTHKLLSAAEVNSVKVKPEAESRVDPPKVKDEDQKPIQPAMEAPDLAKKKKHNKWEKSTSQEAAVTDETKKED